ncbi:MAG: FixH family protein [Pseudohongiellaceae bacterium]
MSVTVFCVYVAEAQGFRLIGTSQPGGLSVSMESRMVPLAINQMHAWVIGLSDSSGRPLGNAEITVTGGMPVHNHGLPTEPMVTQSLGEGSYLLEGMRFHMHGLWELRIQIMLGTVQETVNFTLEL